MTLYLAFVAAVAVLVAIPGPNVALIVANSVAYGARFGLVTVAGTTLGVAVQLALAVSGMAALMGAMADLLGWLRWLGVAYLVGLGLWTWSRTAGDLAAVQAQPRRPAAIFWQGTALAVVNPKTLLFYGAFLPQFVRPDAEPATELAILGALFLAVVGIGDGLWALAAGWARHALRRYGALRNRITGAVLVGAGVALALARR
ncbi:MAG: LysE family translocator [Alphaproteobacteria bacterium]